MRILFDARMLGHDFGIGVYIRELARRLPGIGTDFEWLFLIRREFEDYAKSNIVDERKNVKLILSDIGHYSWAEQWRLPAMLLRLQPDLVHFPNFNVPLIYSGKFVVTVHDLVHHKLPGHRRGRAHKRAAYKMVMNKALQKSKRVITVSHASKKDILAFFPKVDSNKIVVIPEAVDPVFSRQELPGELYVLRERYGIQPPYLLFVGVWEVKKNLPFLVQAFAELAAKFPNLKLVLAGKEDPWHPEVREQIWHAAGQFKDKIIVPGVIDKDILPALYRHALAFVSASTYEGFGLPGLEAMSSGTPVVVADIEVFREIYGEAAIYFDAKLKDSAVAALEQVVTNENLAARMAERGLEQAKKYRWEETAARTLEVYEQTLGINL